ncbi:uncharacterized protein LOC112048502 [Bicyclus anynana]|uniref:Uncharacterized protein LOC112048502 n=1 Tax=Bicyclus anynana TaxID=110368 RepID=A0A6J1N4I7_BICAN|nr:uncharacterized protein LOC112048502 [Bicyclus anynana]
MSVERPHPEYPRSNVAKFGGYDPNKYALDRVSGTVRTNESLTPGQPARLTQPSIDKFLRPLTRELDEVPPRPTIQELSDTVIDKMVQRDKAFWVDKPGANAYTLHDAYYNYDMVTEKVLPPRQAVFPRSYQYDLDCVKYRRQHPHGGLKQNANLQVKEYEAASDSTQKRWRSYPDLTTPLTPEQILRLMKEVGRPFKNDACNWYYENYPTIKYNCIVRKFSK